MSIPIVAVVLVSAACTKEENSNKKPATEILYGSWVVTDAYTTDSSEVGLPLYQGDTLVLDRTNHFEQINNRGNIEREGTWNYQNEQQILSLEFPPHEISLLVESVEDNKMETTLGRFYNTMEQTWWVVLNFKKLPHN